MSAASSLRPQRLALTTDADLFAVPAAGLVFTIIVVYIGFVPLLVTALFSYWGELFDRVGHNVSLTTTLQCRKSYTTSRMAPVAEA